MVQAEVVRQRKATSDATALISGLLVQTLVDPERAPTGADVVRGLRALVAAISG